jgi:hypothetical protein
MSDQYDEAAKLVITNLRDKLSSEGERGIDSFTLERIFAAKMRELCAEKDAEIKRLKAALECLIGWAEHYSMVNTPLLNQSIANAKSVLSGNAMEGK